MDWPVKKNGIEATHIDHNQLDIVDLWLHRHSVIWKTAQY